MAEHNSHPRSSTTLELIAAAFNQADLTPRQAKDENKRFIGFYYDDSEGIAQLVAAGYTAEKAIDGILSLKRKDEFKVNYEEGCGIRLAKNPNSKEFNCYISALDTEERGVIDSSLGYTRNDKDLGRRYIGAAFTPPDIIPEEAAETGKRAIVFYQPEQYGVARFVVVQDTAEKAITALIKSKGEEGISVDYEQGCCRREALAKKSRLEREYREFECTLSALTQEEQSIVNNILFKFLKGSIF